MNLNVDSWKEFRLGDLFSEMYKAEAHVKGELECYDVPLDNTIRFVSRTEMNNGCDCYVLNNGLSGIEKANAIAIGDTTATCFYQGEDFVCGDHMVICRADWINLHDVLFRVPGVLFQPVLHIGCVGVYKTFKGHIQISFYLVELFTLPSKRLPFRRKATLCRLVYLALPIRKTVVDLPSVVLGIFVN